MMDKEQTQILKPQTFTFSPDTEPNQLVTLFNSLTGAQLGKEAELRPTEKKTIHDSIIKFGLF